MAKPLHVNANLHSKTCNFLRLPVPSFIITTEDKTVGYYYNYFQKFEANPAKKAIDPESQYVKLKWKSPPIQPTTLNIEQLSPVDVNTISSFNKPVKNQISNVPLWKDAAIAPNKENINFDVNLNYVRLNINDENFYANLINKIISNPDLDSSNYVDQDSPINLKTLDNLINSQEVRFSPKFKIDVKSDVIQSLYLLSEGKGVIQDYADSFNLNSKELLTDNSEVTFKFVKQEIALNKDLNQQLLEFSKSRHVGYILDKYEIDSALKLNWVDSKILANPELNSFTDPEIVYGSEYAYSLKNIYEVSFVTTDDENKVVFITGYIASTSSNFFRVSCVNQDVPPYPSDINFIWNEKLRRPTISWSHPVNSKRDIKGFLIFKRQNVDSPFRLLRMFDFNDASPATNSIDVIATSLVDSVNEPVYDYNDDTFIDGETAIYTLVSYTAHGVYSRYSAQFEISWDDKLKKLTKKLISRSGAPLSYPNLYLKNEVFKDCIVEEKFNSLNIYFDPTCHFIKGEKLDEFELLDYDPSSLEKNLEMFELKFKNGQRIDTTWEQAEAKTSISRVVSTSDNVASNQKYVFTFLNVNKQIQEKYELKIVVNNTVNY